MVYKTKRIDDLIAELSGEIEDYKYQEKIMRTAEKNDLSKEMVTNVFYLSQCFFHHRKAKNEYFEGGKNFRNYLQSEISDVIADICLEGNTDPIIANKVKELPITITIGDHEIPSTVKDWYLANANILKAEEQTDLFTTLKIEL